VTAISPEAAGPDTERRSARRAAPRSMTRAERAIRTAPNPGTSRGGALGAAGGRGSARTASGRTQAPARTAVLRDGALSRMAEGELGLAT
jgi:hypothetical protein